MFQGRRLLIATKHKKERVIGPLVEKALGVSCFVTQNFDSDVLGTFTGEVDRKHDPITTARQKCLMAMEMTDCDLGIASEGSFGQHPSLFFVNADEEFLIFIDKKNNLEIISRELSAETNFDGREIQTEEGLFDFANSVGFPSHGLILRKGREENTEIFKGITDEKQLVEVFRKLHQKYGSLYVETDMRALYNPTRMGVIEVATKKLLDKISSLCPQCRMPGFGITDAKSGLKCSLCGSPTRSTLSYIRQCLHCHYFEEEIFPHKKTEEDPMYCDFCNP
ncbi:hypothetical protein MMU07_08345 [Aquiflexum sp. LQ15W]|uniref:DUF6671 family protein n=1 Tax=Cognataquiflexum nitidum TaxID=2922272 RepID=UPI001F141685|nr:DUF6671 family protein [Cognataquiflexum nitidum]MCH6199585.1 hypothetical protein [Cognataquiflexum nitidum]